MTSRSSETFARKWQPCTGNLTIGRYLERLRFPISFRKLVYRWIALGKPHLRSMRIPLDISLIAREDTVDMTPFTSYSHTIQQITEKQEKSVIDALRRYCADGTSAVPRYFSLFASYLDIYCALHVELTMLEEGPRGIHMDEELLYVSKRDELLSAFELDREMCACSESHACLGQCLWGDMYYWTEDDIKSHFVAYKRRSPSFSIPQSSRSSTTTSSVADAATPKGSTSSLTPKEPSSPATSPETGFDSVHTRFQSPAVDGDDEWRLVLPGFGTAIPFSMSALSKVAHSLAEDNRAHHGIQPTDDLINSVSWEQAFTIIRYLQDVRPNIGNTLAQG